MTNSSEGFTTFIIKVERGKARHRLTNGGWCPGVQTATLESEEHMSDRRSSRFMHWARDDSSFGTNPSDYDGAFVASKLERLDGVFGQNGYFPLNISGLELVPDTPCLMVSNHSGGTTVVDGWGFMYAWYRHFGVERPLHALAHEMVFSLDAIGAFFSKGGVLKAHPDRARQVLTELGRDCLVMPGGDKEVWRPHSQRFNVNFGGRLGYARLAIKAGVPVVPIAHLGAHETFWVLTDGREIARRLHLRQWFRTEVFPVHLSLPWGLGIGPLPHIPTPISLRYQVGPALHPIDPWRGEGDPPRHIVEAFDERIRHQIQEMLDHLHDERTLERQQRVTALRGRLRRGVAIALRTLSGRT